LSFHDRGVWFELLMLMHESDERGILLLNGSKMPEDALAQIIGLDKQILTTTLTTLLTRGVASICDKTGAIMCRRMVADENLRKIRQNAGKMGGNPVLLNQNPTTGVKQIPTPSSSSSSSSSDSTKRTSEPSAPVRSTFKAPSREEVHLCFQKSGLPSSEEEKFWNHYMSNGWKVGKNRMQSLGHAVGGWAVRYREGDYLSKNGNGQPHAKSPGEKAHERDLAKLKSWTKEMEELK
jgi:hypothetical protein